MEITKNFLLDVELKKTGQKTVLEITEKDLKENQDKVLSIMKKENVDLNSWFYIILYYYSKEDYTSFEKFTNELSEIDVEKNSFYRDQKTTFIHIINIISLFYSFIAYRSKDKNNFESYSTLSTKLSNKADSLQVNNQTIIITAFFSFIQGDYDNSERYFSNYSDHCDKNKKVQTNITILSKLGRALIAYNQCKYDKAIEFFTSLITEYNYINENILESLGICYYKGNKIKKAQEIFKATLAQYPNNYKIKTYLALIKLSYLSDDDNNNFNEAFEELMMAYKMNNFNDNTIPALLVNLCNIFLISGKFEEAGILCEKLNNQLEYGEIKFNKESKNENTLQNNSNIKGYNEIKSAIFVINAKYLLSIGKKEDAFIYFLRSVQENTNNIEAQFGLGRIYLLTQNFSEAENCFMECKNILDENKWVSFKILKYLGYVLSITKYKEIEKSIDLFKQAIEIKKDDIDCYIKLGELLNLREPDKSLKYYMKAVELIKMKKKEEKKNEKEIIDEPSIYSQDILPELLNNIGCTLLVKEEYKEVEKYLNEAKNIIREELKKLNSKNKNNKDNKDNKNNIDNKENEEKKEKEEKKKITRLRSLQISVDFNLALYYDSQAQFDYSHFLYKKIISENPYFIEAYIKLSELYRKRGNKVKAEYYIKLAIENHFKIIQEERKVTKENEQNEKDKDNALEKNTKDSNKDGINKDKKDNKDNNDNNNNKIQNEIKTETKAETKTEIKKVRRLISVMNKPVNPMIIQAHYLYENGKEHEAIGVLNKILLEYYPHDPYTLTFLANIYYSMSVDIRSKSIDKEKMKKAIELYFRALEYDKYNALAAVGLSNCLCEFNYVDKAIDIYRSIMEKFPNEYNAIINSSLIYMDDKKYEKASILLRKVLVNIFHGNNAKIENLLAKCCIEMKEFKSANQYIKNLIMKYPDNPIYQYNYAFLLFSQFDDIINKSTRKYTDTEKAIKIIDRAFKIFEELSKKKKDEKYDKIIDKNEFFYKCGEMKNICSVNKNKAKDILNEDLQNEKILKKKNEENNIEYRKLLEEKKVQKEEEEKKKEQENTEKDEKIKKKKMK
jgi:tetratricopeptide (TPR) repeat protein